MQIQWTKVLVLVMAAVVLGTSLVRAQDDDVEYAWGEIVDVSAGRIVVNDYNDETEEYQDTSYVLEGAVEMENLADLSELTPGMTAEIGFVLRQGRKVVVSIYADEQDGMVQEGEEE